MNGKRLGTFSGAINGAEGVNLASIPFAAIERVEVLKDGASAVYGSDAIGGVINFIMRQDFTGVEATAWYGAPTRSGGGDQYQRDGDRRLRRPGEGQVQRVPLRQLPRAEER